MKLFSQKQDSREGIITRTACLGIFVNILIAAGKILAGTIASSIAIISSGVNNATDALTSILTLVGTKLAGKHPDKKHPFGYGRLEYLTGLVIAGLILFTGAQMLKDSVQLVFQPETLHISYLSLLIVAVSAVVKFFLGIYTIRMGKKAESGALVGVGKESRNDAYASVITIASALLFLFFDLSVDAYAGILTSLLILKAGFEVLKETVSALLGQPGKQELAAQLYRQIRSTPGILAAADMMLHNYGPDAYAGSVNVELDHSKTVGEVYALLHELQLSILHTHHVTMVFGVYAVDNDHQQMRQLRRELCQFVSQTDHVNSFHAVYLDSSTRTLYCDLIVDYALKDWEEVRARFTSFIHQNHPDYAVELTLETEYV